MFGRTTLQQAIRVNLKNAPKPNSWGVNLPHEELSSPEVSMGRQHAMDASGLFQLVRIRRELKRGLLDSGTMDRHLDGMLKTAINRDSIVTGACPPLMPIGHPFFSNAMEADEFYYPKHLRGLAAERLATDGIPYPTSLSILPHHFVTRVLPEDAVPTEHMDYKTIPFVVRMNEDVQKKLHVEHSKFGDDECLQHINL